ncbi:MAG TPA: YcaO-like family protein [Pyrinomonadaceae bacterium]|nr:YcaO-like family protein [Pyrinomonadaceae bacterium]
MSRHFRLSSSLRAECLDVTLNHARSLARGLGISRVTDITRLDCVGVPVFASIRPDAQPGSLCVNAGKGITVAEARAGAYMEAIEYAFAEYNRASLEVLWVPAGEVYEGKRRQASILDFCPVMNAEIDLEELLPCVATRDLSSGRKYLVPAELVFLPYPRKLGGSRYFGSNSNGLCSGNSVLEATIHGIAEVIERDVCSFQSIKDTSELISNRTLPASIRKIETSLSAVGMNLHVRYVENMFRIPYFMAVVAESKVINPIYVSVGYGCHPLKEIALTRAVCEALQSRLSFIHGGRDDLVNRYERFKRASAGKQARYADSLLARVSRNGSLVRFGSIPDHSRTATDLPSALNVLLDALAQNGFKRVLRVVYTRPRLPLQVLRVIVPRLECFTETTARVGVRLRDYVKSQL